MDRDEAGQIAKSILDVLRGGNRGGDWLGQLVRFGNFVWRGGNPRHLIPGPVPPKKLVA